MSAGDTHMDEILVVDDEPANLRLLQQILREESYRVRLAADGELALRSAEIKPPALVLLDIRMPGMDGYEVCRRLKANEATRSIPVIFLSALEAEQDKVKAFEVGGVDYVTKPIRAAEVMARIGTHLALRNTQLELEQRNIQLEAIQVTLEERVKERSAELEQINATLRHKVELNLQTLAALRKSERERRRMIDIANEGIWVIGADAKTAFVNTKMAGMLGWEAGEMTGLPMNAFMYEEDEQDYLRKIEELRSGLSQHYERRFRHKAGHSLHTLVSVTPIFDDADRFQGAFGMFTDITERKQAEEQSLRRNLELEERVAQCTAALEVANKELEAFSHSVSHDLRVPLRAIEDFSSALEEDCSGALNAKGQHYLAHIRQNIGQMGHLIDGLPAQSRVSKC